MKLLLIIILVSPHFLSFNQLNHKSDSIFIRSLYDMALEDGRAYEDLRSLCKDIGARLSGSAEAEMAVKWGEQKLKNYSFDKVYLQEIMVPHWERGTKEAGWFQEKDGRITKVNLLALGGSIGTGGMLSAPLIMFETRKDLLNASSNDVKGKIVFINHPMNQKVINTFKAYGGCYPIRGLGANDAAKKGAVGVIIRSLSLSNHDHPHTGTLQYNDSIKKIPAAAISTNDANKLNTLLNHTKNEVLFSYEMNCQKYPDKPSHNVIAEIKGSETPNHIITVGGHLDSWDVGEGAHDDGAGIVHSMEALRLLKESNYKPKNTLRVVFFMNEENGNMGGKSYAIKAKEKGEKHIAAIESDRGGFSPRGFSCDGTVDQLNILQSFEKLLSPYDLHKFKKGYGGVDINPLKEEFENIALFGFIPDSQRYFDFHHNANDIFENVNKRELELGAAAMASIIYLLDRTL